MTSQNPPEFLDPVLTIMDRVPSMLAYWDRGLTCRFANAAYVNWFGVDPATLIGRPIQELLGPELYAANKPHLAAALRGEEQIFERAIPGPMGVTRHSLARYLPHVVDGEVMGFIAEVNDVTLLHEVRRALQAEVVARERACDLVRTSEAALRQAQRVANIGSWSWEIDTDITSWSEQLYVIFGLDSSRLPPSYAEHGAIYTEASWLHLQRAVAESLATGAGYTLELEYIHSSGRLGWIESRGEVERDATGDIVGLHGTGMEITQKRKARESEVRRVAASGLQGALAAERSRSAGLEQALEQAKKLESVGLLAGGMAHDFNNVLAAVSGALHVVSREVKDERVMAFVRRGQEGVQRASKLVRQLMDILRTKTFESQIVRLGTTIGLSRELLQISAGARTRVRVEVTDDLCVRVDPHQLEAALINLVINARDAMPHGGDIIVSVAAISMGPAGREYPTLAAIRVQDSGEGMPPDVLMQAREPFFTTKPVGQGTGLGLVMVNAFARHAGGSVLIESEVDRGTAVTILLPIAMAESGSLPAVEDNSNSLQGRRSARILVVDDDVLVRPVTCQFLRELGCDVIEAESSTLALQMAASSNGMEFDLVVTDVGMPDLDGPTLAARLREMRSDLPILLMTGDADAVKQVAANVLRKPFTLTELANHVFRLLDREEG